MRQYTDNLTDPVKKSVSDFVFYNCGIEQCAPGHSYGPRRRNYHFIHFVLAGSGTLEIQGTPHPVRKNQLFIVPAGELSTYRASEKTPWEYAWIGFMGMQSEQFLDALMDCSGDPYVLDCESADGYAARIESVLRIDGRGMAKHLRSNGMLFDLIGTLLDEKGADEPGRFGMSIPFLARQYLDLHYEDNLRIADVAAEVGVHVNYLADVFKKHYGVSPKQYLMQLKVHKAKELLQSTADPVYLVASSVGFSDALAFSKFFRRSVGLSPTEYRAQRRRSS